MTSAVTLQPRLASLDQFRGYTIAGMCLVNFLAPFAAIHSVLKHNDTYFSYADTIMPSFLFVVGFAFRLTYLKRRRDFGPWPTARSYIRRSGRLLLLSLLIYAIVGGLPRWFEYREMPPEFGREKIVQSQVVSGEDRQNGTPRVTDAALRSLRAPLTARRSFRRR